MLNRWLIFLHVLSAITFFMAHGSSVAMAFRVRKETDLARIRAMLDLSVSMFQVYMLSFVVMGLTGLTMPFIIGIWDKGWIWSSIILMLFVTFYMGWFNEKGYKELRRLVGLPYMRGFNELPAETPASVEAVTAHIKTINVHSLIIVGYGVPAVVLWLMIFKPF